MLAFRKFISTFKNNNHKTSPLLKKQSNLPKGKIKVILMLGDEMIEFIGSLPKKSINSLVGKKNICVTMKRKNGVYIHDYCSENWSYEYNKDESKFVLNIKNIEILGIFTLVAWLYSDLNTIIDVASKYGNILTHDNSKCLFLDRVKDKDSEHFNDQFIFITYY